MAFSFIDIEQKKTRVIGFLFVFVSLFYFVTAYLVLLVLVNSCSFRTAASAAGDVFVLPSAGLTIAAVAVALFVGIAHWTISTSHVIEKISLAIGADALDEKDVYHQTYKNILEEVAVAIGGRRIEGMVISSTSLNAFALEDFNGRAVIGITEGLLARCSRAQIEAVVGHEAGHIVNGDCLSTTVTCALAEIYEETFARLSGGIRVARGRGSLAILLIYFVIGLMRFLSTIIRCFISREKEYRADASSVRLTRDPLSLAEALELISRGWRGAGMQGEKMQSIFIMNPDPDQLDEKEGMFADMFSTHPPIKKRIGILLNMAHMDEKTLEENLKNFKRASPVAKAEYNLTDGSDVKKWFIFMNQQWAGPYLLGDMKTLPGLMPDLWIRCDGDKAVKHLYEDKDLLALFSDQEKGDAAKAKAGCCPHCQTSLDDVSYEGVPIQKCSYCQGLFVEDGKISRILIRQDRDFSEEALKLAETVMKEKELFTEGLKKAKFQNTWVLTCSRCGRNMRRQFFVYSYPVEIDRCIYCGGVWFDRLELEILQYIYEHKERFFDGRDF